jgi:hypothetical protein
MLEMQEIVKQEPAIDILRASRLWPTEVRWWQFQQILKVSAEAFLLEFAIKRYLIWKWIKTKTKQTYILNGLDEKIRSCRHINEVSQQQKRQHWIIRSIFFFVCCDRSVFFFILFTKGWVVLTCRLIQKAFNLYFEEEINRNECKNNILHEESPSKEDSWKQMLGIKMLFNFKMFKIAQTSGFKFKTKQKFRHISFGLFL